MLGSKCIVENWYGKFDKFHKESQGRKYFLLSMEERGFHTPKKEILSKD